MYMYLCMFKMYGMHMYKEGIILINLDTCGWQSCQEKVPDNIPACSHPIFKAMFLAGDPSSIFLTVRNLGAMLCFAQIV